MKDPATTLLRKIRDKETMPTHWYSCKCIRHRMGTGVERLQQIDAANLKCITFFFSYAFFFPYSRPINSTYEERSRKGLRHNQDLSRKKWETPRLETPQFIGFGKRGLLEKGSFQESPFSSDSREFRDSRDSREPPDSGKQRRIQPF